MPKEHIGTHLRTMTYDNITEFINEQREIEMGAFSKRREKWTRVNEDNIVKLRKLFERTWRIAQHKKAQDPFSKQKWVNVDGMSKIITKKHDAQLDGRWKMGYSVNHEGKVQFFHRKVPDSIRISSPKHKGIIPGGEIIDPS